jgi:hypothetical protein
MKHYLYEAIKERLEEEDDLDFNTFKHFERHLWDTVRYYMSNPLKAPGGILLNKLFKFELPSEYKITKFLEKHPNHKNASIYKQLLNKIKNGKRQASKASDDERAH